MPYSLSLTGLLILSVTAASALILCILFTVIFFKRAAKSPKGQLSAPIRILLGLFYLIALGAILCAITYGIRYSDLSQVPPETQPSTGQSPSTEPSQPAQTETTLPTEPLPTEPPEPTIPDYTLPEVGNTENSDPENWNVSWEIIADGHITDSYQRPEEISFGNPNKNPYFALPGISTFRGDNYRTGAVWGTTEVENELLTDLWFREISAIKKGTGSGVWTGCGWTGQPLIVQWDEETKQIMNLYPSKKAKEGLVEVIYATLDGHIYFYDLDDGSYTRDPMDVGMAFKGAGSLDPRGYPIMYVGAGDKTASGKVQRMFVISLIDCSIMYEYGNGDDWRHRTWTAFDSAPLVHGETDTLIWPGESGILYTMKLNTQYDKETGTVSVNPDQILRTRYKTSANRTLGYEASAIAVENYLYIADNGGMMFCVDLNTLALVWAQNLRDDNNATPVFEWAEDGTGYLYTATSMEYCNGSVYMYKINASTGEIVWENHIEDVYFDKSVSGGVLSSPVLGKRGSALEGMIFWSVSRTPGYNNGELLALDTETGEILWESQLTNYCWSSPLAVYNENGDAWLIICDSMGNVILLDSLSGQQLHSINIGSNIEASPAMFNDILVVGTRGMQVHGIKLS